MLPSFVSNKYITTEEYVISSVHILSFIFCCLVAAFAIRKRFSLPLLLLVIAHPSLWLTEDEQRAKSSVLFALCSLVLILLPHLLPSGPESKQEEDL